MKKKKFKKAEERFVSNDKDASFLSFEEPLPEKIKVDIFKKRRNR